MRARTGCHTADLSGGGGTDDGDSDLTPIAAGKASSRPASLSSLGVSTTPDPFQARQLSRNLLTMPGGSGARAVPKPVRSPESNPQFSVSLPGSDLEMLATSLPASLPAGLRSPESNSAPTPFSPGFGVPRSPAAGLALGYPNPSGVSAGKAARDVKHAAQAERRASRSAALAEKVRKMSLDAGSNVGQEGAAEPTSSEDVFQASGRGGGSLSALARVFLPPP